jgi:hypothetical protein
MSTSKKLALGCLVVAALMAVPSTGHAFPACDSFGQDWSITLGPFGGTFPGALLTTGCRDCNGSLGCGGTLPLDGAAVVTTGTGGAPFSLVWSMTAYKPSGSASCVSTHWTGSHPSTSTSVHGNVSNEFGPFGPFTLSLGVACREGGEAATDPSR